nr:MAG TPA: hypothetical protein [Caudoviricetes sp.]
MSALFVGERTEGYLRAMRRTGAVNVRKALGVI